MKNKPNIIYDNCKLQGHEDIFLDLVCVEQDCLQQGSLTCVECSKVIHPFCQCLQLLKFLKQFNDQLIATNYEDEDGNTQLQVDILLPYYNQLMVTSQQTQKSINDIFDQVQSTIQSAINLLSNKNLQQQIEKITKVQSNFTKEAFENLLKEIESFGPNSEKFNFTIKKPLLLDDLDQRNINAKVYVETFQKFMDTLKKDLQKWQNINETDLKNFFLVPQKQIKEPQILKEIKEELLYIQQLNPEFKILTENIKKLHFLNDDTIAGIGGNLLQVFKASTRQIIFQQKTTQEITDIAYLEIDSSNGMLYFATKQGEVTSLIFNNQLKGNQLQYQKTIQADIPGNLLISIHQKNKTMITLGEEKTIKIWSLMQMLKINEKQLNQQATILHINDDFVFCSSNNKLTIFNAEKIEGDSFEFQAKIIGIVAHQKKLYIGLEDQIQIFSYENEEFSLIREKKFEKIQLIQSLDHFPIVLIACTHQPVYQYNYEMNTVDKFYDQPVEYFTIKESCNVYHLAFGKEKGTCVIGKLS